MNLEEVAGVFDNPLSQISSNRVLRWMRSDDFQVRAACFEFVIRPEHVRRIVPSLSRSEVIGFVRDHLLDCIVRDVDGEWSQSRYQACGTIARYLLAISDQDSAEISDWAKWLGEVYGLADQDVRLSIETGTLEHVLGHAVIKSTFVREWQQTPELLAALTRCADGSW